MIDRQDELYKDFEAVRKITIVPTMLDVVCRITGMGFAAVARVTESRWLACSVKDDVNFGLAEGGELKIESTICNEIRDSREPVVFDEAAKDERFCNHHTPKLYGLQSYISFPIILKDGSFFGTLCAIDSKPASVNRPEITGTFKLFAELLAFHLDSIDLMDRSHSALKESNKELGHVNVENELYKKISRHNIQEQVRKIALFSNLLAESTLNNDTGKIKETATKINVMSEGLNKMIQHVTRFAEIENLKLSVAPVALNEVIAAAEKELKAELADKNISLSAGTLPVVYGDRLQLKEVFVQLLEHAVTFSEDSERIVINIYPKEHAKENTPGFCEIIVVQTGLETDERHLKDIFELFMHSTGKESNIKYGNGLAYSRKIIQNHGGDIKATRTSDNEISFSIFLPLSV